MPRRPIGVLNFQIFIFIPRNENKYSAQLRLSSAWLKLSGAFVMEGRVGGVLTLIFFLSISFSWVNLRLHTKNQLHMMPGSALKVEVEVPELIW